jgi:dTDP-4-amino-4,6-dideoxygalactose transaminase
MNFHQPTRDFEQAICDYAGAPYCVAVDNASNALWLCLMYHEVKGKEVFIPMHTYPSVPCEIALAGGKINFIRQVSKLLKGEYQLAPFPIWDSALRFTADMYRDGQMQCVSFTGPYKHLKLGKGGAILLDNKDAYEWLKRMRNSGRGECSYHVDEFTLIGRNCYMHPTVAALGLQLIQQFYNLDGSKKHNEDAELPYPDLSRFEVFTKANR